ncbi:sigma-54 interaction domain-containing protein [Aquisalibacillus elongatus]|uniref:PAS domain S-box-containing protein n=1 Tax=Aquisalibacillus elongatus TaxID=485577 RepID=A0A3N5B448_9BACI|nr:sigma 54-interacting transcriptional regulator [Aquisalibacillus elongatus]RPF52184.1 PAS domain S-box-containing protein [Aquisalibacillus elongatus]
MTNLFMNSKRHFHSCLEPKENISNFVNANNNSSLNEIITKLQDGENVYFEDEESKNSGFVNLKKLSGLLLEELQHIKAYFHTVLETIDESCTVIDKDKNVMIWTKGAENIFSIKKEEILGKPITDFFSPDKLQVLETIENGTSLYHSQHEARDNLVVMINSNPIHLNDDIIGAVVSETDITSQIKMYNELYNASEKVFNLEKEVNKYLPKEDPFQIIRGNSVVLNKTINLSKKAAKTNTNILIHGESGVGKELFAKAIHNLREESSSPFVAINCGAIPEALFESEMFGYEKGAFSGADQKGKKGKVELAKGGTLFLDEIGEMPLDMQVKMLRLLQERKFYRVGGTKEIEVDFRIIAATNRDLRTLVDEGEFREDLFYRLNVVSLEIPPLRLRPEDIIELTHYFLHETSIKYNKTIKGVSQMVMQALLNHNWPGNIRELKNVVERLVVFAEDGEVSIDDLPFEHSTTKPKAVPNHNTNHNNQLSLNEQLQNYERDIIISELNKANGNKQACAEQLSITRATLYNRIKKLGIKL